ncbi:S-adenosylmethionine decarboxylase [Anaerobacillus sp. HL2]|nr:S-adenosylmethionine decarboxylase [Anaerobacillus sp. HL2]
MLYENKSAEREAYLKYIDEQPADRLTKILTDVTSIIGAHILNIAKQDYEPQGSKCHDFSIRRSCKQCTTRVFKESPGPFPETVLAHLDKSHITVHTYPEYHPDEGISTFRADIDVSTCGEISPLKALELSHTFF